MPRDPPRCRGLKPLCLFSEIRCRYRSPAHPPNGPSFDEDVFRETSSDIFFKIQAGWANRDLEPVKGLLTSEMFSTLKTDVDELKREKKVNRLDNIAVRSVDLVEVWQETGSDYVTVRFLANLLDYTVDEATGQVISGSKVDPVKFEEYWTFTRPVGNHPWKLSQFNSPRTTTNLRQFEKGAVFHRVKPLRCLRILP